MVRWLKENNQDKAVKFVLFLILPVAAFLYSLRSINRKSSYVVFFLFALLFGVSFTVPLGKSADFRYDGASYREKFVAYIGNTAYRYQEGLQGFLTFEKGKKDYYFDTVAFYVSRVTENYHVLFLVLAFVFAFFALKSFRFLTSEAKFTTSLSCFILAYLFMSNQIFNINGVRFWTAAWVGVYCIFQLVKNKDKRYVLLALCTPFIHGAFWVYLAVLVIVYFFKRYEKSWVILFFISFFASSLALELTRNTTDFLPPFLAKLVESYTDKDYVSEIADAGSGFYWVAETFSLLVRVYMNFLVYLFIKNATMIKANSKSRNLYLFLLVWMTFVNFTMPIPSLGGRFFALAYPVIAYVWLVNFKGVKYKQILYALPFIFVMSIYQDFVHYMGVLETKFFISNPFSLINHYLLK